MDGKFKKNDAENMEQFTSAYPASPDMLSPPCRIVAKTCRLAWIDQSCCLHLFCLEHRIFYLFRLITVMSLFLLNRINLFTESLFDVETY